MLRTTVAALLVLAPIVPTYAGPAPLTAEQWREDLRTVQHEIETRHPNPYNRTSKATLDAAFAELEQRIPSSG